jgi:hypothetical protein
MGNGEREEVGDIAIANRLLPITYYQSPITYYQSPITYYQETSNMHLIVVITDR